ncbi:MAG: ShlB/FhaC/HecB family hemolysin secretion/activation protein [Burkholderia cenocepacia]
MLGSLVYGVAGLSPAKAQNVPALDHPPSSGSILQSNPVLSAPGEPRGKSGEGRLVAPHPRQDDTKSGPAIHVARIEIGDVPPGLSAEVSAVLARYENQDMTLAALRNVAVLVTQVLLDHGETLSYAYVPTQDIADGVVRLAIKRGRVESTTLESNHSLVSDRVLHAYLERGISPTGDVRSVQDQLTRMGDLPGVAAIVPTLSAGKTPGGTAVSVAVQPGRRVEALVMMDNAGSSTAGRNRMGAQLGVNSPLGLGDRLQAVAYGAPDFFQRNHDSDGGHTWIGRLSYDLPVGARGARLGVAASRVNYVLGGGYRGLGDGYATVYSLYGSYPVVRTQARNLSVSANLDFKRMSDNFFEIPNDRKATALTLQLNGDEQGRLAGLPNIFQYQLGLTGGVLGNKDDWLEAHTDGRYVKTTQSLKLTQGLRKGIYVDLSVSAQQTSSNLDGAEKLVLGGPTAVRAYSNDAVSVDSGVIASATLNMAVPKVNGLTAQVFYDWSHGRIRKFVTKGRDAVRMAGYGVGATYTIDKRATMSLSYALRDGGDPLLGPQHKAMVWVNAAIRF